MARELLVLLSEHRHGDGEKNFMEVFMEKQQNVIGKFLRQNPGLIPGILSLTGTAVTLLIHTGAYNKNYLLLSALFLLLYIPMRKSRIIGRLCFYSFAAIVPMMFLQICIFQLTFKAPFLLSLKEWILLTAMWLPIFVSGIVLQMFRNTQEQ